MTAFTFSTKPKSLLFVCLGNICRSPAAHEAFAYRSRIAGRTDLLLDSCGTGDWHVGQLADPRMRATAKNHGVEMTHRARTFTPADLDRFDLILPMDFSNRKNIFSAVTHHGQKDRIRMFREWDPENAGELEVPDPYYGGPEDFEKVWQMVDRTAAHLLQFL